MSANQIIADTISNNKLNTRMYIEKPVFTNKLDKIIMCKKEAEIMNKDIDMDTYNHSTVNLNGISMKKWCFNKEDTTFVLKYSYGWKFIKYSAILNNKTGWYRTDEWSLSNKFEKDQQSLVIYNINKWIKENIKYIKEYDIMQIKLNSKINLLENTCLGNVSFNNSFYIGWTIKNEYNISINKYKFPSEILVTFN
jgi:hypothetical protein